MMNLEPLRRSFKNKPRFTAGDLLAALGRGILITIKEAIIISVGAGILFCLVVAAMMVDIGLGRLTLILVLVMGVGFLARAIGRFFGGGR